MKKEDKNNKIIKNELPSIDDFPSRRIWGDACWEKILNNKKLLCLIITAHERHDLVLRAAALDRLSKGDTYSKIGEEFFLSPQTISGIKKILLQNEYQSYLERSKKERKKRKYSGSITAKKKSKPLGRPVKTKYGKLYI